MPNRKRSRTVLIVEDTKSVWMAFQRLFALAGWSTLIAPTVADAIALLGASTPDAVFLDLMLPDGGGVEVLREVRRRELPCRVVVVSGVGEGERLDEARAAGADAVLNKPAMFDDILAAMGA
jgi:DNA-binding response OmpR family regulator